MLLLSFAYVHIHITNLKQISNLYTPDSVSLTLLICLLLGFHYYINTQLVHVKIRI